MLVEGLAPSTNIRLTRLLVNNQVIEPATYARIARREADPANTTVARWGSSQKAFRHDAGFQHCRRLARRRSFPPQDGWPSAVSLRSAKPMAETNPFARASGNTPASLTTSA